MSMERTAPPDRAKEYLESYSLKLGPNLRGVMVIKSKDKTRASQRKGALANWKVSENIVWYWSIHTRVADRSRSWLMRTTIRTSSYVLR